MSQANNPKVPITTVLLKQLQTGLLGPVVMLVAIVLVGALIVRMLAPMNMVSLEREDALVSQVMQIAGEGNEMQAESAIASSFPGVCVAEPRTSTVYDDQYRPVEKLVAGPESDNCSETLASSTSNPDLTLNILKSLDSLALTGAGFQEQAAAYARSGNDDILGWNYIPGGDLIRPFTRERLSLYRNLDAGELSAQQLRGIADNVVKIRSARSKSIDDFVVKIRSVTLGDFSTFLIGKSGMLQAAFFAVIALIGFGTIRRHSGWQRALGVFAVLCFFTAYLGQDALESLSLKPAGDFYSSTDGLESIVGLPFIIVGQVVQFFAQTIGEAFAASTIWHLVYFAVLLSILTQQNLSRIAGLVYLAWLIPQWAGGTYHLLPFEADALDANAVLALVVWLMRFAATLAAALLAQALWSTYSRSLVSQGVSLLSGNAGSGGASQKGDDVNLPNPHVQDPSAF